MPIVLVNCILAGDKCSIVISDIVMKAAYPVRRERQEQARSCFSYALRLFLMLFVKTEKRRCFGIFVFDAFGEERGGKMLWHTSGA